MRDYPLISDYIEAIKAAEDNCEQLKHLRPVLGVDGNPVMSSGNFAVVFKMIDENTGKFYAVKCFLKEQEGREEAYRLISEELNAVNSPYLTPIKYLDKELFVDSRNTDDTEFPVLLMDWVEGTPLDKYIQVYVNRYQRAENLDEVTESQEKAAELIANAYELDKLSYQFSRLAVWLLKQPFAHGDLKPDNIMVKEDGAIVLVDYDGMYVPAMKGQKARELGSPDFRHPLRTIDDFDEHIDDFPLSSILLSLLAIATRPALFDEFGDDGRLLFTENDYRNLAGSNVLDAIKPLIEDKNLTTYLSLFYLCSAQKSLFKESYHLFYLPEPIKPSFMEDENMSTKVSRNDLVHPWMDVYGYDETESYKDEEYGLLYSEDKRRLLRCSFQITICTIIEGTKIICDHAFLDRNILSVQIPESVMAIGKEAFCHCHRLESITIPEGVHMIGDYAFANCYKLATIHLPESLNVIGDDIFYNCNRLSGIYIPKGFKSIYEALLPDYKSIIIEEVESEDLSTEVTEEDLANAWTDEFGVKYSADRKRLFLIPNNIIDYKIRKGTKVICDYAFGNQGVSGRIKNSLKSLYISADVKVISSDTLFGCQNLSQIIVDDKNSVFDSRDNCNAIIKTKSNELLLGCQTTNIPPNITSIADNAFLSCVGLNIIHIPNSVITIGSEAFMNCSQITHIHIPSSVKKIGNRTFNGCNIEEVTIDDENNVYDSRNNCNAIISSADNRLVFGCKKTIIPDTVTIIGYRAFECCELKNISIPNSVKTIEDSAFVCCSELQSIYCSSSLNSIGGFAFGGCKKLTFIRFDGVIEHIGSDAFFGCDAIKKIIIPMGTKGDFIKTNPGWLIISKLEEQEVDANIKDTPKILDRTWVDDYGVKYSSDKTHLIKAPRDIIKYSIREGTKYINDRAFDFCVKLVSITIPESVMYVGDSAFGECHNLSEVKNSGKIETVGDFSFAGCRSLKSVKFNEGLVKMGGSVFKGCVSLHSVYIPSSVTFFGDVFPSRGIWLHANRVTTFDYCESLKEIIIPVGSRSKFEKLLPIYKDKLVEKSNVVSITFDNNSTSKVDRCRVFKKNNEWKLEVVYKNGMKIEYPHSLLRGNQSIVFDKQTIDKIQLYVGNCEVFYINPKAVKVDFEYPAKYTAKILFDSDYIEISGITWGLNNNINEWIVKGLRSFNLEERLAVNRAEVVPSKYGNSICFYMTSGGQTYIPLDSNSTLSVGDELNMNTAKLITLCRKGNDDIVRVME